MKNRLSFKSNKNRIYFLIFSILAILVMISIFLFSAENSDESSGTSGTVINFILKIFYPGFNSADADSKLFIIESFQHIIRKLAHGSIYATLGFFCSGAAEQVSGLDGLKRLLFPWGVAVCYCVTDELHQYFVPGRSCQFTDILIDSLGAAVGVFVMFAIYRIIKYFAKKE